MESLYHLFNFEISLKLNKEVMRFLMSLLCFFIQRLYGSSGTCPSHRVIAQGGKQFSVIPGSPPISLGCKQVFKGTAYVISSEPPLEWYVLFGSVYSVTLCPNLHQFQIKYIYLILASIKI